MTPLNLLPPSEQSTRFGRISEMMRAEGIDHVLISDNANIYYLTGRVIDGYILINADGSARYFVRRPLGLSGNDIVYIHKPEHIAEHINLDSSSTIALELDLLTYAMATRLMKVFDGWAVKNASPLMRRARAVKTPFEIERIAASGVKQERVYRRVPHLYRDGMTDLELQVEIERTSRLEGCLGQFRISGDSMELYMGNILVGDNADNPTPYDFAMGGQGIDPSLPVGADGTVIRPGMSVMVDVNGNYTGYMTDMTRTYAISPLKPLAEKAHQCSIDICAELSAMARPGVEAKKLYERAEQMAREADLYDYFMGHHQKAGFVGHGLGIEINEMPVIAPRSRDILEVGNVFALEPKFVIPGVGAVGIENTYVVEADTTRCLTNAPQPITYFE